MLSQQAWVLSLMLPLTRFAEASAGIWPETKIWPLARMAWDWFRVLIERFLDWFFFLIAIHCSLGDWRVRHIDWRGRGRRTHVGTRGWE